MIERLVNIMNVSVQLSIVEVSKRVKIENETRFQSSINFKFYFSQYCYWRYKNCCPKHSSFGVCMFWWIYELLIVALALKKLILVKIPGRS